MFTIKLYDESGHRQIIRAAESFTILRSRGEAEITLHLKTGENERFDIKPALVADGPGRADAGPPRYAKAIIENAAGKTTEILSLGSIAPPSLSPRDTLRNSRPYAGQPSGV